MHLNQRIKACAFRGQKPVVHRLKMLGNDKQAGFRQQVMDVGNPAGNRIFHRHHGKTGPSFLNTQDHLLKRGAGQRDHLRFYGGA